MSQKFDMQAARETLAEFEDYYKHGIYSELQVEPFRVSDAKAALNGALDHIGELEADALKKAALLDGVMCNCNQLRSRAQKAEGLCKELESENERLAKMFADDCYIESAHMEPGYYNINTRGKGAMLLVGQLLKFCRESSMGNFVTCTFQMGFEDPATREQFELTIQKIDGMDTPAQKIQRQREQIEALKAGWIEDRAVLDYIGLVEGYDYGAHVVLSENERSGAEDALAALHPELFGASEISRVAVEKSTGGRL